MTMVAANLGNLKHLWFKYGALPLAEVGGTSLYINTHWPHRVWLQHEAMSLNKIVDIIPELPINRLPINRLPINRLPIATVMPLWPSLDNGHVTVEQLLLESHWSCSLYQTAMGMNLEGYKASSTSVKVDLSIQMVTKITALDAWVKVGSEAFGYQIEQDVVTPLIKDSCCRLFLVYVDEIPEACGLLLKTSDVIGIHQVGVHPDYQGQGIAKALMLHLIDESQHWGAKVLVLQASEQGKPLYERLGFEALFEIKNYRR